jgi:DNA ligase-1
VASPLNGIHLPELGLWLDPHRSASAAFISHAHSDHVARHRQTLCSALTGQLIEARYGRIKGETIVLEYGVPYLWRGHELRLLPAGHIVGSAMLHITRMSDGASLLYTGDYKLRQGLTTERAVLMQADTLIMETTFGLPKYVFPPLGEIVADMQRFVQDTLDAGGTPLLLGYSLGKAQEILAALAATGLPVMLHPSVLAMTDLLAPHLGALPGYRLYDAATSTGHVLIFPPTGPATKALRKLPGVRAAMLSGWAVESSARYRFQVDAVFPLSDHADYPELLATVAEVQPRRVLTVHGYTREFAADLRRLGYEAWTFVGEDQLELRLDDAPVPCIDPPPQLHDPARPHPIPTRRLPP